MTRTLCLRSSKLKATKSTQEGIFEDCKENSPIILSQSRTKKQSSNNKKHTSNKENVANSSQSVTNRISKNNNKACLHSSKVEKLLNCDSKCNLNTRTGTENNILHKKVLCDQTNFPLNRRNQLNQSPINVLRFDNSSKNNTVQAQTGKNAVSKQDIYLDKTQLVVNQLNESSERFLGFDFPAEDSTNQTKSNICFERKTSPWIRKNLLNESPDKFFGFDVPSIANNIQSQNGKNALPTVSILNKKSVSGNCMNENESSKNKIHIPIYKTTKSPKMNSEKEMNKPGKKESVYEFEVDENEEPISTRKRRKKMYTRRPKVGPKALTINNIKYSSSENLVYLPEKPKRNKKKTRLPKPSEVAMKPSCSLSNLNETDSCFSINSFRSHPPSVLFCDRKKDKQELSVLQESESEEHQTQVQNLGLNPESYVKQPMSVSSSVSNLNTEVSISNCNILTNSHIDNLPENPNCYKSNTNFKTYCNTNLSTFPPQNNIANGTFTNFGSCSPNISTSSSVHDFLSSTPCKPTSLVVFESSVHDNSNHSNVSTDLRPSTGFIKNTSTNINATVDKCFGFDEPEELEEPLVSPIKKDLHKENRTPLKYFHSNHIDNSKSHIREVINILKATVPQAPVKESSDVFERSPVQSSGFSPKHFDLDLSGNFKKPPRKSYERQRRVQYHVESEEESEENNDKVQDKQEIPKVTKKCYKKTTTARTAKPVKPSKGKLKIAKEEEEIERLAALMNAQFNEIDKVNLVVE